MKRPAEAAGVAHAALLPSEHSSEPRGWGVCGPGPLLAFLDLGVRVGKSDPLSSVGRCLPNHTTRLCSSAFFFFSKTEVG